MPQVHGKKIRVPVLLDRDILDRLTAEAKKRRIGVGTLIRMIVIEFLDRVGASK